MVSVPLEDCCTQETGHGDELIQTFLFFYFRMPQSQIFELRNLDIVMGEFKYFF